MYKRKLKGWVKRQFRSLPERIQKDVAEILIDLLENPYPADSIAMVDEYEGFRRIRVDGYRMIYKVNEEAKEVWIWKITPRTPRTYNNLIP